MAVLEDRVPGKPGRVLVTPEDGGAAFYATLELADEPVVTGNKVNRQNVIDTIIDALEVGTIKAGKTGFAEYVGTGTNGADNPCSVTFDFAPKVVLWLGFFAAGNIFYSPSNDVDNIWTAITALYTTDYTLRLGFNAGGLSSKLYGKNSDDGKTIYWYNETAGSYQLNSPGYTYYFLALA